MVRTAALIAIAIALAAPANAQVASYKLVITWYQSGVTVIDYPSLARCERAAAAVNKRMAEKMAGSGLPIGGTEIAFCIPG